MKINPFVYDFLNTNSKYSFLHIESVNRFWILFLLVLVKVHNFFNFFPFFIPFRWSFYTKLKVIKVAWDIPMNITIMVLFFILFFYKVYNQLFPQTKLFIQFILLDSIIMTSKKSEKCHYSENTNNHFKKYRGFYLLHRWCYSDYHR